MAVWPFKWDFNPRLLDFRMRDVKATAKTKWGTSEKLAKNPLVGGLEVATYHCVVHSFIVTTKFLPTGLIQIQVSKLVFIWFFDPERKIYCPDRLSVLEWYISSIAPTE